MFTDVSKKPAVFILKMGTILDFKLSPCPECFMLSFGWFYTHLPAYEDGTECFETSAYKIQTPGSHPKESIQHGDYYLQLVPETSNLIFYISA